MRKAQGGALGASGAWLAPTGAERRCEYRLRVSKAALSSEETRAYIHGGISMLKYVCLLFKLSERPGRLNVPARMDARTFGDKPRRAKKRRDERRGALGASTGFAHLFFRRLPQLRERDHIRSGFSGSLLYFSVAAAAFRLHTVFTITESFFFCKPQ